MNQNNNYPALFGAFLFLILFVSGKTFASETNIDAGSGDTDVDSSLPVKSENSRHRRIGVDYNFVRKLSPIDQEFDGSSGSIVFFDNKRNMEFAVPALYRREVTTERTKLETFTLDFRVRRYLLLESWPTTNPARPFLGSFFRYTKLKGAVYAADPVTEYFIGAPYNYESETKTGVGVDIGFRLTHRFFYWGASIGAGIYTTGRNHQFRDAHPIASEDNMWFFDIELLKFGLYI